MAIFDHVELARKWHRAGHPQVAGYQGMNARAARVPPKDRSRLREALDRLIEVAEARGYSEAAAKWRKERDGMSPR